MFMFWPVQITHQVLGWFGLYRSTTTRKAHEVLYQESGGTTGPGHGLTINTAAESDSDDSSDDILMFGGKKKRHPVKSPKNAGAFLEEDGQTPTPVLFFRSASIRDQSPDDLKPGEHRSSLYAPSGGFLTDRAGSASKLEGEVTPTSEEIGEPHIYHRSLSHRPDFGTNTQRSLFSNNSSKGKGVMIEIPEAEEHDVN